MKKVKLLFLVVILCSSCSSKNNHNNTEDLKSKIFEEISSSRTNITFSNNLKETEEFNYFNYTSIYMGGGVSVGDVNNDGMLDVFFTGNQVTNRLYINQGDLKFQDFTQEAKVGGDERWYTGSTMVDINNDGYLDIYCSVSGKEGNKKNQLFINNKNNTFTESAEKYGLADNGNSVQATFFDYDNDGDLDVYIANYPIAHPSTSNMIYKNRMQNINPEYSDKLYRNDDGNFIDVSKESGIENYSFSLGITVSDLNNDGWKDIYVSNDYSIPDFLYINNANGTFKEVIKEATSQTAFYGMGVDIADINNDGFLDVFQADMDSDDNRRQKANMASMNPRLFYETVLYGFHYQYMHNSLQLNSGLTTNGVPQFSNVSRLTGTSSTDWSWGPVFADFDNDGLKDLFVTNGTRREVNNKDFFNHIDDEKYENLSQLEKIKLIPSEPIDNFMFKNEGNLSFKKVNEDWGIKHKGFSNGVVYADLDNDGDLEIITSNVDEEVSIFENKASKTKNYIKIKFEGSDKNKFGLGAKAYVFVKNQCQFQELTLTRGFQSSVAPELHFGLNVNQKIDSIKVVWNDQKIQVVKDVHTNQNLVFKHNEAQHITTTFEKQKEGLFTTKTRLSNLIKHRENDYNDFETQVLLPHKMSTLGPALSVADINGDGLEDIFIGGSFGLEGSIYLQENNQFIKKETEVFKKDKISEDIGALFFDPDNDGDQDLYVVSGGYEYAEKSKYLVDRLYVNDGKGNFTKQGNLPSKKISGSKILTLDFNKDGKKDVLVLGRQVPGKYPLPASSYLLKNTSNPSKVSFEDSTAKLAPGLINLGMATDAVITDFNNDSWEDIIIVGEWMSVKIFKNNKGVFEEVSQELFKDNNTTGWWWSINKGDFDNDGDEDYIIGNNGLNYKYKATKNEPFDIYVKDFDKNFTDDIVLSYYNQGAQYPVRGRQCSSEQIPTIKDKFKNYNDYAKATLADVYGKKNLESSLHYQVESFASIYLENKGSSFKLHELPIEAQFSSIQKILVKDYNGDGNKDIVLAGNLYASEVETPRNDASYGLLLKGNGKGNFESVPVTESGLYIPGDVKDLQEIEIGTSQYIIAVKNNNYVQFIKINKKNK